MTNNIIFHHSLINLFNKNICEVVVKKLGMLIDFGNLDNYYHTVISVCNFYNNCHSSSSLSSSAISIIEAGQ